MNVGPTLSWMSSSANRQVRLLREAVTPILANNLLPHFTDHSVSHSDRLAEISIALMRVAHRPAKLSNDEAFVLFSTCYLHDIGMQYERAGETDTIRALRLPTPWDQLDDNRRRQLLRQYHHTISAELVQHSTVKLPIDDDHLRSAIAALCEAHGLDTDEDRYAQITAPVGSLRLPLLAGLLRVADILDETRRRIDDRKANSLLLETESEVHWWRHRYTSDITFDNAQQRICLHFTFPPNRREEYSAIIPHVQVPEITDELARHSLPFIQAGLGWSVTYAVNAGPYATAPAMPDAVLASIQRLLHQRKENEAGRRKQLLIHSFLEAQPLIDRRIADLTANRDSLSPVAHAADCLNLAKHMRHVGGRRSAWMLMMGEFSSHAASWPLEKRTEISLWLIEVMLEDDAPREALRVIQTIQAMIPELPRETRLTMLSAEAQVMFHNGAYEEAVAPLTQAIRLDPHDTSLRAMLAELNLLHGKVESVRYRRQKRIERTAADARGVAAVGKAAAMMKGSAAGLRVIDRFVHSTKPDLPAPERISLEMLKSEVLMLDGREADAAKVLQEVKAGTEVRDPAGRLEMSLADNESLLATYLLDLHRANPSLRADLRRLAGVRLWDPEAVVAADDSVAANKHWEALPLYWQDFVRTYELQCWRTHMWAAARLAKECMSLDLLDEAVHFCVIACDMKLAKLVGECLLTSRDSALVERSVTRLLNNSSLLQHSSIACQILLTAADVISDTQAPDVVDWALSLCHVVPDFRVRSSLFENTWKLMGVLAPRVPAVLQRKMVAMATSHPLWSIKHVARRCLVDAVHMCARYLPKADVPKLADAALPLALDGKSDIDYAAVLNLLCVVAERGGKGTHERIGIALFPRGTHQSHPYLAQVSHVFADRKLRFDNIAEIVEQTAERIRLWVQHVRNDGEPRAVGYTFGHSSSARDGAQVIVQMAAGVDLGVVVRHAALAPRASIARLCNAIGDLLGDGDNSLGNKAILVQTVEELSPHLTQRMCREFWKPLCQLASGDVGDRGRATAKDAANPLNPFKINDVLPGTLSGLALRALASLEHDHPGAYGAKLLTLIEKTLFSEDTEARAWAYAAAANYPRLSASAVVGVLLGTRDGDAKSCCAAFNAVRDGISIRLASDQWDLLLYSVRLAAGSQVSAVRRAVARLVSSKVAVPKSARRGWREVRKKLLADICWSVRDACRA